MPTNDSDQSMPDAREGRAFHDRAIRYLARQAGIRQFLDIGTGLPAPDNTHEVAQAIAPESRVVYVDNDPMVLTHARALTAGTPEGATSYIDADLREPATVLKAPELAATLDLGQPVVDTWPRDRDGFARFFDGLQLVEPGIVPVGEWRPDHPEHPSSAEASTYGAVARK